MPSPLIRICLRILAVGILAGAVLGLLPPVAAREAPPTVVRTVGLDEARLLPRAASMTAGGGLRAPARTWTPATSMCAPIRFTMLGFVWEQSGERPVVARVAWGSGGRLGPAQNVHADLAEGPDPDSPDDAGITGTAPVWTGEATCASVRIRLPARETLSDVRAVFINTSGTATEPSLLDRAAASLAGAWGMVTEPLAPTAADALTTQPPIITRAAWGADEKMRNCGPSYAPAMKMAFVHHTVNANGYGASKADDLVRGIYAYHTGSRGFCDIAYNFLIDRFGRIYEGRYGGMEAPVIGAHAMGFNTGSSGVAGIGTFTSKHAPKKMISAYKRLLAWRLDVAHVRPTGTAIMTSAGGSSQKFKKGEEVPLPAIAGHKDTGYTACPGGRLYTRLATIRPAAEARGLPKSWSPAATPNPSYPGQPIQITATLSEAMDWTIDITPIAGGAAVRQFTGSGETVAATWDRTDQTGLTQVPAGTYLATIRASTPGGLVARDATITLTLY